MKVGLVVSRVRSTPHLGKDDGPPSRMSSVQSPSVEGPITEMIEREMEDVSIPVSSSISSPHGYVEVAQTYRRASVNAVDLKDGQNLNRVKSNDFVEGHILSQVCTYCHRQATVMTHILSQVRFMTNTDPGKLYDFTQVTPP